MQTKYKTLITEQLFTKSNHVLLNERYFNYLSFSKLQYINNFNVGGEVHFVFLMQPNVANT